jgi:uncharacterized damage-inducible protein DinB
MSGMGPRIARLCRFSAWAGARLFDALAALPPEQLAMPRAHREKGILGVLSHIYVVDRIWQANLEGRAHGFTSRNLPEAMPFAEARAALTDLDRWYVDYAAACTEAQLEEVVDFHYVGGQAASLARADMLMHIVNHRTWHRGYIADMMYESGSKPPTIDLNVYLRDVEPVRAPATAA